MIGLSRPVITSGVVPGRDCISLASLFLIRVRVVLLGLMRSLPPGVASSGAVEEIKPDGGGCDRGFVPVVGKSSLRRPCAQLLFDVLGLFPAVA